MSSDKISLMKKFSPRPITERLMEKYAFYYDEHRRFWAFNKDQGVWKENAEEVIDRILRNQILGEEMARRFYTNEVIADVRGLSYHAQPFPEAEQKYVPFANQVYDLSTGKTVSFSPFFFLISKLAVDHNPDTHCPTIDQIFEQIAPGQVEDLYDLIALCLFRGYPLHKFWVLYGPGRNGKSVFASILTRILGKENVATISLLDIENNRFASSQLFGKFANIGPEQAYDALHHTARLKQLSGGDLIFAERKFGQPFNFTNHAKLIFLTNELPQTSDKTRAFYSRVKIINFPNVFEGEAADKRLVDNLTVDEFDGLAFKCLERLQDFYNHDFNNVQEDSSDKTAELYERLTDPLTTFLKEKTIDEVEGIIPKWELTEEFNAWCGEKGFRKWTDHRLGKEMKNRGYDSEQRTIENGKRWWSWIGLQWAEDCCGDCSFFSGERCWMKEGIRASDKPCESFKRTAAPIGMQGSIPDPGANAQDAQDAHLFSSNTPSL